MRPLLEELAALIGDYRSDELDALDADEVGRWVAQFDAAEREPVLRELIHVWRQIYIDRDRAVRFLTNLLTNNALTGGDHREFWEGTEFLNIQQNGHSQADMLRLLKPILRDNIGLRLDQCGGGGTFLYIDDVLFSGSRARYDLTRWLQHDAPDEGTVYVVLMASHRFGEWQLEREFKAAAQAASKKIKLEVFRCLSLENRKSKRDVSDVLWPTALVPGADMYACGNTGHIPRNPPSRSSLFSSEPARHALEQAMLKAGLKIRSFSANPSAVLRPLGFGPFGVGFGSLILTFRNCPNNAPLALWWGDPDADPQHPFSKWRPLVPRKTYGDEDD